MGKELYDKVKPNPCLNIVAKSLPEPSNFRDKMVVQTCKGVGFDKWEKYIDNVCKAHGIDDSMKLSMKNDVECTKKCNLLDREFEFPGELKNGEYRHGQYAAVVINKQVQFVLWYYKCSFAVGKKSLSLKEGHALTDYFKHRAIELFTEELPEHKYVKSA